MASLKRHARLLYILALFQMVGGPVVLWCLLSFSSALQSDSTTSMTQALERTIQEAGRIEATANLLMESGEPLAAFEESTTSSAPARKNVPKPAKGKDKKAKFFAISESLPRLMLTAAPPPGTRGPDDDPAAKERNVPPSLPPPRV